MIMEVVCGSTAVEPPMSPRSPPGGGLDLYGKGDRWLKFRFWRERLACFRMENNKKAKDKLEKSMVADNESGKSIESEVRTSSGMFLSKAQKLLLSSEAAFVILNFVPIFCAFVALVVACIVYKCKTAVRAVRHFAHYARAASAAAATAREKGLIETVANVWDFHASAMLAAASSLQVSFLSLCSMT
ncbi:hypothetical protein EZV62_025205 [Acer yangbiense]|uniref:Uncharacterized protein n=1 Tax=Acer yangbiense TaxID=1000413 RepID=A0A5C7GX86_9ROSI|nr:hypothetical protein EZV62_025205 [Acer yangbiense]